MQFVKLIQDIKHWLFGPASQFKVGDTVQAHDEGSMMVVVKVYSCRNMHEPLILCKWYDKGSKTNRTNLFLQSRLRLQNNYIEQRHRNLPQTAFASDAY